MVPRQHSYQSQSFAVAQQWEMKRQIAIGKQTYHQTVTDVILQTSFVQSKLLKLRAFFVEHQEKNIVLLSLSLLFCLKLADMRKDDGLQTIQHNRCEAQMKYVALSMQ